MKKWFIRLTLIGFGFGIAIVALEFALSTFAPQILTYPPAFTEPDRYLGWKGVPYGGSEVKVGGTTIPIKRNSHGFRDIERTYEKGKDTFRILVLDGSLTEAIQVPLEETFPYILEHKINSETGKRVEVLNLGIGGFGTGQEYLMLKYHGSKYQPDFVILGFIIAHDVSYNSFTLEVGSPPRPSFVLNDGKLEELPFKINDEREGIPLKSVKDRLRMLLPHTYYLVTGRVFSTPWSINALRKIGIIQPEPVSRDTSKKSQPSVQEIPLHWYDVYAKEYSPQWENAWEVTKALILKLKNELEMKKIGFLVVLIPMELEFRPDRWEKTPYKNPRMRALTFEVRKPERILSTFLGANNIDYLLLRPAFEQYTKETGKEVYLQDAHEIHWNDNGHRLVAELIYKKLYSAP